MCVGGGGGVSTDHMTAHYYIPYSSPPRKTGEGHSPPCVQPGQEDFVPAQVTVKIIIKKKSSIKLENGY